MVNLKGVDDRLIFYFNKAKLLYEETSDFKVIISQGIRTEAEQLELFKKGRKYVNNKYVIVNKSKVVTYTLKSKHIEGKAIDIAFIKNNKCDWSVSLFKEFWEIINKIEILKSIEWGGNWKNFKDYPHFQIKN